MEPKQLLRALGVSPRDIAKGEGRLRVTQTSKKAKVLSVESQVTTPVIPQLGLDLFNMVTDIVPQLGIPFLQKTCSKYRNPKILYTISPIRLVNVKYHVWSLYLEGDIENKLSNKSKEGEEGITERWFFESCPDEEDEYDWEVIEGSADLESSFIHEIVESKTDEVLDEITDKISAKMKEAISAKAHWKTKGLGDLIFTIVKILMTGGVVTENGYDITVTYEFRGSRSESKHIDMKVWIPVKGYIQLVWD